MSFTTQHQHHNHHLTLDLDSLVEEIEELLIERPNSQGTITTIHQPPKSKDFTSCNTARSVSVPRSSGRNPNSGSSSPSSSSLSKKCGHTFKKQFYHSGGDLDLDDLMNELNDGDSSPSSSPVLLKRKSSKNLSSTIVTSSSPNNNNNTNNNSSSPKISSKKCSTTYLSNRNDSFGINTFLTPKRCSDVRCMKCDFKVINFDGRKWKNEVNYLFFRNNYPETVRKGFEEKEFPDLTCYCCQCSWITVSERTNTKNLTSLNWYCGGHKN